MKKHALAYAIFALLVLTLTLPLLFLPVSADCTVHHYNGVEMPMDKVYAPSEVEVLFGNGPANCLERGNGSFTCDDCGISFLVSVKGPCDCEREPSSITLPSAATDGKLVLTFDCSLCEESYVVATDSFTKTETQALTCAQSGITTYTYTNVPHPDGTPLSGIYNEYTEMIGHYFDNGEKIEIDTERLYPLDELTRIFGDSAALTVFDAPPADCSTEAQASFVCSGCGKSFLFKAVGEHTYSLDKEASTLEEGTFVYVCAEDATHTLTVQASAHEVVEEPATCLADGRKFLRCTYTDPWGVLHTDEEILLESYARLPYHTFGGKEIDLTKTYTVSELKTIFGEALDGLTVYDNMRPSCDKSAPASFKCEGCDVSYLLQHIADHTYSDFTEYEPTCTTPGYRERICSACSDAQREETGLPALPHTYGAWEPHDGEQHVHFCECGEPEYEAHNWDAGVQTTPPTLTAVGEMTYTCATCLATKTAEIPKLEYTKPTVTVSLALGERFAIHAKILLPAGVEEVGEIGMLVNGESVLAEYFDGIYRINNFFTVAVKDADKTVTIRAYYTTPDGETILGDEYTTGVALLLRTYAESDEAQLSALATATLHYIAAAQDYFGCDVLVPVNDGLAPMPSTGSYADHYMISTAPAGATVRPLYLSLVLGDTLGIKAVFSCDGATDGYRLAVSRDMDMTDATLIPLSGTSAVFDGILPRDFDTTYYFRVLDADGNAVSATFTYGVSTYCARVNTTDNAKLAALLDSMLALYEVADTIA